MRIKKQIPRRVFALVSLAALFVFGAVFAPARLVIALCPDGQPGIIRGQDMAHDAQWEDCTGHLGTAGTKSETISSLLIRINAILNYVIPFIIGLAVLVIIWGVFNYIIRGDEEEKRDEAKKFIIWGVIGVFFMLSIWGFISILINSLDLSTSAPAGSDYPQLPAVQRIL